MIDGEEIVRSLKGSWRLLVGDARGMALLDTSIEGFWRSFAVMILCLPVPWVELQAQRFLPVADRVGVETMSGPLYWIGGLLAYAVSWIAFPLLLAVLARTLGIARVYVPYMVARNWATPIGALPSFVFTAAFLLGLLPLRMLGPLNLAALGFGLYYAWQVTRIACATPTAVTGGLVALDFLVSLLVYTAADRVIGL